MVDIQGNPATTTTVASGSVTAGAIEIAGDHDWYKISLSAGQTVIITVTGGGNLDPALNIYDPTGTTILASNDDITTGQNTNSRITFTASTGGTYFIDVGAFHDQSSGTYDLLVQPRSPVWSNDQIANQLTTYYWGNDLHHFNVTPGGTLTVNISGLTADEQTLARAALADWTDISGIHFQEVTAGAQINFSDAEDPSGPIAQTSGSWSNGIINSADVQISSSWITQYGSGLNSYSFQAYIHEIGHALGLGHAGEYNVNGDYLQDAVFANDAWSTSVMSYFSPRDAYYFNNQGFSKDYDLTPMVADILAIQQLYGLSTTTRNGDTVYGYNSNSDNPVFNAALYPTAALTIYDSGGNDTLDYSGSSSSQLINLNPETFSSVNGQTGNLTIARGVVIENAIGGSADDTIIQNAADNILKGGAGTDTVSYETASAAVSVNLGLTTAQNTGGAGVDTLSGFERLIGSAYSDTLIGGASTVSITGGAGDDIIDAGASNGATLRMLGGDGNDTFILGAGAVSIDGGSGFNTVDGSRSPFGLVLSTGGSVAGQPDTTYNVQKLIGSSYADNLSAAHAGEILIGGAGDDTLTSFQGGVQLCGGTGNDYYNVHDATDQVIENSNEGVDTVSAACNYILGANLENLKLHEYLPWDPYQSIAYTPPPPEDWSATGNSLANVITGNLGNNILTGLGGADTLTGGGGNDIFQDTAAGLNGDHITDFGFGDKVVITDATLANFSFTISGNTLNYTGGSLTFDSALTGRIVARAAPGGGVQLQFFDHTIATVHDDFNGDGRSDLLLRNDDGTVTDFLAQPNGMLSNNSANFEIVATPAWHIVSTGDFNGDGRVDIMWRADDGTVTNWLGQSDGSFSNNWTNFAIQADPTWHIVSTGDFNGDGFSDIIWRSDSGTVTNWLGQSNGSFTNNWANFTIQADPSWHIVGTGDFNGDGYSDIIWRSDSGIVTDWLGQSNGGFYNNWAKFTIYADPSWHIAQTGDFNGDGRDDIMWRSDSGSVTDWLGQPDATFFSNGANYTIQVDSSLKIVGAGDFDGDHKADLLWRSDGGQLSAPTALNFTYYLDPHWHTLPDQQLI